MSGGIIIQRNSVVLIAITDTSFYSSLTPSQKTKVDAINAKDPASRTQDDLCALTHILNETAKHT
jgi:hypothetical protein